MSLDPFDGRLYNEGWDWGDNDDEVSQQADSIDTVLGQALERAQNLQRSLHDINTSKLKDMKFDIDVITFLVARVKFMYEHEKSKPTASKQIEEPLLPYTPSSNDKKMLNNMGIKESKDK